MARAPRLLQDALLQNLKLAVECNLPIMEVQELEGIFSNLLTNLRVGCICCVVEQRRKCGIT